VDSATEELAAFLGRAIRQVFKCGSPPLCLPKPLLIGFGGLSAGATLFILTLLNSCVNVVLLLYTGR